MQILTLSLLVPVAYVSILLGSMATFSYLYRSRQVNKKLRLAPYFPEHTTRNIYLSLLHLSDADSASDGPTSAEKDKDRPTKVPDSVLRAALLARACDDIRRIMEVRVRKPALAALLQRGVVGDEIFQRLQRAEQELELEIKDVVAEANALSGSGSATAGTWGQTIFQSANEMVQNQMLRDKLDGIKAGLAAEKERWDRTRESARKELLGGGPEGEGEADASTSTPAVPPTSAPTPASAAPGANLKGTAGSSDEDGIIVETPTAELPTPGTAGAGGGGGGGKNKKKKGKK
ncbi:Translocation protein sec66 [Cladophialophora carrionii]|uniref:Translocation protein sec66 n=1 Tax=Cladophialophora carrionii TaxID=86049 RepID=A0A1C1D0F9_9EURO|nr:Translocation protein sec66 [Cladophialophora carrionii]